MATENVTNSSLYPPTVIIPTLVFDVTRAATSVSCILSVVGTAVIFVTYILWQDVRSTSRKILVYISAADFVFVVCNFLGIWHVPSPSACFVQSFTKTAAVMSSTFWTVALAVFLYVSTALEQVRLAEKLMWLFHAVCWLVPLAVAATAASCGVLGESHFIDGAGWCWIKETSLSHKEEIMWMLLTGMLWQMVAFPVILVLYVLLKIRLRKILLGNKGKRLLSPSKIMDAASDAERKLIFVPLTYLLLNIWGIIRFFIYTMSRDNLYRGDIVWLTALQGLGNNGQGFANFLLFCVLTRRVMDVIKPLCQKWCPCLVCCYDRIYTGADLAHGPTHGSTTSSATAGQLEPLLQDNKPSYSLLENQSTNNICLTI